MSSRHSNGEGTIYQRNDGKWCAQIRMNGRRVTVYGASKADTRAKLDALRRQLAATGTLPGKQTLFLLLDTWLSVGKATWKPRTAALYEERTRSHAQTRRNSTGMDSGP